MIEKYFEVKTKPKTVWEILFDIIRGILLPSWVIGSALMIDAIRGDKSWFEAALSKESWITCSYLMASTLAALQIVTFFGKYVEKWAMEKIRGKIIQKTVKFSDYHLNRRHLKYLSLPQHISFEINEEEREIVFSFSEKKKDEVEHTLEITLLGLREVSTRGRKLRENEKNRETYKMPKKDTHPNSSTQLHDKEKSIFYRLKDFSTKIISSIISISKSPIQVLQHLKTLKNRKYLKCMQVSLILKFVMVVIHL